MGSVWCVVGRSAAQSEDGCWRRRCGMYTVARRPSHIVQKTRRGLNKTVECTEPYKEKQLTLTEVQEDPKIVFKPMKMKNRLRSASVEDTAELSPEYKQIVDFVTHGWSSVKLEMEQEDTSVKYYQEKSNPQLADFSPFDLDAWWGRRLYQNLTTGL